MALVQIEDRGLSKWVNNGDNWGYDMAYRSY